LGIGLQQETPQPRFISEESMNHRSADNTYNGRGRDHDADRRPGRNRAQLGPDALSYQEAWVDRDAHRIYARDYPGQEPAIVLMHGFPDNLHLYDRLVPHLNPPRRVITFDFLGWGASDKPNRYPYTATNQTGDLDAVINQLGLEEVTIVVHDASGPVGIDWALEHRQRVAALVLLNTYYCAMPGLRSPEAIWLFSTPAVRRIARPLSRLFGDLVFRRIYDWQVGRFFRDAEARSRFMSLLYEQFVADPTSHEAFFGLNQDLPATIAARTAEIPRLQQFDRPVRIIFGAADPYLNARVARRFHELLPTSELFLLPGARHYVQVDEPAEVARLLLTIPEPRSP
jgi:haloalkane dehalogenase